MISVVYKQGALIRQLQCVGEANDRHGALLDARSLWCWVCFSA